VAVRVTVAPTVTTIGSERRSPLPTRRTEFSGGELGRSSAALDKGVDVEAEAEAEAEAEEEEEEEKGTEEEVEV